MRKLFVFVLFIFSLVFFIDKYITDDEINNKIKILYNQKTYSIVNNMDAFNKSNYAYSDYSNYVHTVNDFNVKNKSDLLNTYYTIINNGWENFSFYCDNSYTSCLDDINALSNESDSLSSINQLVHPYNSFKTIKSNYNSNNRVDVSVTKKYSSSDIKIIDMKIIDLINRLNINNYSNVTDKIKIFHDYIASTNKYDTNKLDKSSNYNSDSAIGTLFEGYSICSGYTDTMAIFLNKINVENIRIANDKHTWNLVKLNNNWYHLDLTWDDPVMSNGSNIISHDYFLINTYELINKHDSEHSYNKEIYNFVK